MVGKVCHFVGIVVKVIEFINILEIPNVLESLVANGAYFKAVAVVVVINTIG